VIETNAGKMRHTRPIAYQRAGGRRIPVETAFRPEKNRGGI
jgi:hypothetical protein